ncbi:hypothetical protein B0H16DRAFT_1304287 [Mycena metata]|uniref:FAD/NAD(P)-binding domain-containing protein n=1 Tax=Mycena metata TaxID=1033252 RepID=A0AAD7NTN5_9AGAR|nr:hypothetical protein B0H16DRAFT_1304287 [Mycena metata]
MQNTQDVPNPRPKRILVIGGGVSGLVTLRNLRARGGFDQVQLVERRDHIGGVWYLDENRSGSSSNPRWPSPAYPGLIGNVLPEFLSFSGAAPFLEPLSTPSSQPFPSLSETHSYLRHFAAPLLPQIRLNTEVLTVEELSAQGGWRVCMREWRDTAPTDVVETWDAVVIAVANYDHPVFPRTRGIPQLRELGLASHAQGWRGPHGYEGKRVLVVGNANSGNDMAAQLAPLAGAVYQSIRRPNFPGFPSLSDSRIIRVAPVEEYVVRAVNDRNIIDARLAGGTVIRDLDVVLFGTGYRPFPDFIRVLQAQPDQTLILSPLVTPHTNRIPDLHRYTLYARNPTLAFVGTAVASYTPFTIADMCSTWLALAWAGEIAYPTTMQALLEFEAERMAAVAAGRAEMEAASAGDTGQTQTEASSLVSYGVLGPFEEAYAAGLRVEVVAARPDLDAILPVWNPERTAVREGMFDTKRKALELAREQEVARERAATVG